MLATSHAYTKVRNTSVLSLLWEENPIALAGHKAYCAPATLPGTQGPCCGAMSSLSRDATCLFLSPPSHKWHYNTSLFHRGVVKMNTLKPVKCSDAQVIWQPDNYPRQTFLSAIFHTSLITADEKIPKPSSKKPAAEMSFKPDHLRKL